MNDTGCREGLFEQFDNFVEIEICNVPALVPENNSLLRGFQYLRMSTISLGDYCWNGDCTNCQVWYTDGEGETRAGLACRMYVKGRLIVTRLSEALELDLFD